MTDELFGKMTWSGTGINDTQTFTFTLCDFCNKRYHTEDMVECDYCLNYWWDVKCYSSNSPSMISRRWLRLCYKLKIPYKVIRFFFRRDVR